MPEKTALERSRDDAREGKPLPSRSGEFVREEHVREASLHATHLFEEPGTPEEAAQLARNWFERHLRGEAGHVGA
jgi:hypothetical protein